ncbi:MAG TPA: dienelactone hydrolase family protein [Longimicrobiales bacterium]
MRGNDSIGRDVRIQIDGESLEGSLDVPARASGVVLFAHGAGSSRFSPRNRFVAGELRKAGAGTLLFDLLTEAEEADRENVFDIELLAERLVRATEWLRSEPDVGELPIGYFGASTGAAAALVAAARLGGAISAVVSRGGRPDLAGPALGRVTAPTLLIVGGADEVVLDLNREAYDALTAEKELIVVPGATHLFEEPGALERVAEVAAGWFEQHFTGRARVRRAA